LDEGGQQQFWDVLERYQDVFAWNKGELGCCTMGEHVVDTQGFPPRRASPGRLSYWEEAEVKKQIDALVELGKMKPSNSEYACRITLPVKKDGSRRFCGDYRSLNAQTRCDSFSMPLVEDVIDQLGKNATSTFTRTMSEVFKDFGSKFLKVFVDDLNVHNGSWVEHLQHLDMVLCKLREVNFKLNPKKCCFAAKSIAFLGHVVNENGTRPDPGKIEVVLHFS
jgi:hypothetical protein